MSGAIDSRRAWFMWAVGTFAYVGAIFQRTSFAVASGLATHRFSAGASMVSLFVVVQLLTYAGMQIPVGVLVDRFGTRLVVATGAILMGLGQLDLALSTHLTSAIIARVLIGVGDAMTFIAVIRMLPAWFGAGRLPMLNQATGILGQAGQLVSSIPLAAMLGVAGWTSSFTAAAIVSGAVAVVVLVLLRNAPHGVSVTVTRGGTSVRDVVTVLRDPGTLTGFWIHWICSFWNVVFALMWGYPFLLQGLGYPMPVASALFTVMVLAGLPFALLIGRLSRRAPLQRTNTALLVSVAAMLPWVAIVLWPGRAPVWLLVVLMIALAASGPGSGIGFDVARASNPLVRVGTATGVVVVAGMSAAMLNILVIGIVLDLAGGYTLTAFRWAMSTQLLFWAVGVAGLLTTRRKARGRDRDRGVLFPTLRAPFALPERRPTLTLPDGTRVDIAALLPGIGGKLAAIDLTPRETSPDWWHQRVDNYLRVVATPGLQVGSIEIWCSDRATTARTRDLVARELTERGAVLAHEVVTRSWRVTPDAEPVRSA